MHGLISPTGYTDAKVAKIGAPFMIDGIWFFQVQSRYWCPLLLLVLKLLVKPFARIIVQGMGSRSDRHIGTWTIEDFGDFFKDKPSSFGEEEVDGHDGEEIDSQEHLIRVSGFLWLHSCGNLTK